MFKVITPDGAEIDELFPSLSEAMWELRYYMYIDQASWNVATHKEKQGTLEFAFYSYGKEGYVKAVVH